MRTADIVIYLFDCTREIKYHLLAEQQQLSSNSKNFILVGAGST